MRTIMTFSDGSYIQSEVLEKVTNAILNQLKILPPDNQTEEIIEYVLNDCVRKIRNKRILL